MKTKIDGQIFSDPWFRTLSKDSGYLYFYMLTNCDYSGVIEMDVELVEFHLKLKSIEVSLDDISAKITKLSDFKWWIPNFCKHQYSRGLQSNHHMVVHARKSIISNGILDKHNQHYGSGEFYVNPTLDLPKPAGDGIGIGLGLRLGLGLGIGKDKTKSKIKPKDEFKWITDLWNEKITKLRQVRALSDSRIKKLKARQKSCGDDFVRQATQVIENLSRLDLDSVSIDGKPFLTFDVVFRVPGQSGTDHFLKALEGDYTKHSTAEVLRDHNKNLKGSL